MLEIWKFIILDVLEWLGMLFPTSIYVYIDRKARLDLREDLKAVLSDDVQNLENKLIPPFEKFAFKAARAVMVANSLILLALGAVMLAIITLMIGSLYEWLSTVYLKNLDDSYTLNVRLSRFFAFLVCWNVILQLSCIIVIRINWFCELHMSLGYLLLVHIILIFGIVAARKPIKIWKRKTSC